MMEAAEQRKKTHNPQTSAGCQRPGGIATKSARREGPGRAAGGRVRKQKNNALGDRGGSGQGGCHSPGVTEMPLL